MEFGNKTFECDAEHQTDSVRAVQYQEILNTTSVHKGWAVAGVLRQLLHVD